MKSLESLYGRAAGAAAIADRKATASPKRYQKAIARAITVVGIAAAITPIGAREQERFATYEPPAAVWETVETRGAGSANAPTGDEKKAAVANHLEEILDSMLRSERVRPDTPLAERLGEVNDPRLVPVITAIDNVIGGQVEWPHISVVDKIERPGDFIGLYSVKRETDGATARTPYGDVDTAPGRGPLAVRADPEIDPAQGPLGIQLDRGLVNRYFNNERYETDESVRSVLVHELQHALSHDNEARLQTAAPEHAVTSETRATMAALVVQELVNREDDEPRLNELNDEERRALLSETIGPYLSEDWERASGQDRAEMLHEILTAQDYLNEEPLDETIRYVYGMGELENSKPGEAAFVPPWADDAEREKRIERHEQYQNTTASRQSPSHTSGQVTIGMSASAPADAPSPAAGRSDGGQNRNDGMGQIQR